MSEPGSGTARPREWGPATWWNLAWLLNMGYQPLFDPDEPVRQWVVAGLVVVLFVPVYLAADARPGRWRDLAPVLVTALALVAIPFNAGASVLLVYVAAWIGSSRPRPVTLRWFAGLTALLVVNGVVAALRQPYELLAYVPSLILIWVIGLIAAEHTEQVRADRFRNAQVQHLATLSERERIARDLHDLLGQTLTGIVVRAQLAQRLTGSDPAAGVAEMAEVEKAARAALGEVRATVTGWRQVDLDQELTTIADTLSAAGVALTVDRDPGLVLTPSAETALGLALREAVTNVVRHAHATRCAVALRQDGDRVVLEVADDGVGGELREGNGLTGMRERIGALGGVVHRTAPKAFPAGAAPTAPEGHRRVQGGSAVTVDVPAAVAT